MGCLLRVLCLPYCQTLVSVLCQSLPSRALYIKSFHFYFRLYGTVWDRLKRWVYAGMLAVGPWSDKCWSLSACKLIEAEWCIYGSASGHGTVAVLLPGFAINSFVTWHICIVNVIIIGSDDGLSPDRCQAIIWTTGILLIGPLGTNFMKS